METAKTYPITIMDRVAQVNTKESEFRLVDSVLITKLVGSATATTPTSLERRIIGE